MKITDVRAKSADQLKDQLIELKKEQFNLRFQRAGGQLESTGRVRQVRRDIARIKTVMGEGPQQPVVAGAKKAKVTEAAAAPAAPKKAKAGKK